MTPQMTVHAGGLIAGIVMLVFGIGFGYAAIGLIRNLHGFGDKLLKQYADHPGHGGWSRASADSYTSSEGTTLLAFHYVPKTTRQVKRIGWVTLPVAVFIGILGLLFTVAALTGNVD
jgi:hypothetical protein